MRVLTLSWEYPPLVYGGLGRHVCALSEALAAGGHAVTVVAPHDPEQRPDPPGRVRVVRTPSPEPSSPMDDLLGFVEGLGDGLARTALAADGEWDVVTAHDWVVGRAAVEVAEALGLPLVSTLHATEAGRHQGWLPGELSRSIHRTEGWLAGRSARVVVCSAAMGRDVQKLFALPAERLAVIPNGIDTADWAAGLPVADRAPDTVLFAGRLEYEKGVQVLLDALPAVRGACPGVQVLVAGTGTYEVELHERAARLRLGPSVRFLGRVPDDELVALLQRVAVVAIPSLYEPFGMVALEAASCGAPLVVSATGGLAEFAAGGAAVTAPAGDSGRLAAALVRLLSDQPSAARGAATAASRLERDYAWPVIARQTAEVLAAATAGPAPAAHTAPEPGAGNLLC